MLPVAFDKQQLMSDSTLQEIVLLKSLSQQYAAQGLKVNIEMTSSDSKLFESETFRNAITDLNLDGLNLTHHVAGTAATRVVLREPGGKIADEWQRPVGPVDLGLALRKSFGEPIYSQMKVSGRE